MAKEFVDNIYSSCENIVNPSSNSKVMGKLSQNINDTLSITDNECAKMYISLILLVKFELNH